MIFYIILSSLQSLRIKFALENCRQAGC